MKPQSLSKFRRGHCAGFTLAEVLIAVTVCFIGLMGILALLTNTAQNASQALEHTMAALLVERRFTEIRANPSAVNNTSGATNERWYDINGVRVYSDYYFKVQIQPDMITSNSRKYYALVWSCHSKYAQYYYYTVISDYSIP